jgi:hypothetical protein
VSPFSFTFAPFPKLALGAAVALAALSLGPGSAQAYVVTVNSVQYDVTTFTGSYNSSTSNFSASGAGVMPWYGSSSLAQSFAAAVGSGLGFVQNSSFIGPLFAYDSQPNAYAYNANNLTVGPLLYFPTDVKIWAQATIYTAPAASVPGPLPLFGAAAAFGFSRKLRKRIQESRLPVGSGEPLA